MAQTGPKDHTDNFLIAIALLFSLLCAIAVVSFFHASSRVEITYGDPVLAFRAASFDDLPGWESDDLREALTAFNVSCEKILSGDANAAANPVENHRFAEQFSLSGDRNAWRGACERATDTDPAQARAFFEAEFTPLHILNLRFAENGDADLSTVEEDGKFTGYFEPEYAASKTPTQTLSAPVYTRPADLIDVDLGAFNPDRKGERIAGRIEGTRLVPYSDHADINNGAINEHADAIAWMDPNDLLFLQIQGSGRLSFDDGDIVRVGYAAQNGHPYTAIGRVLAQRDIMPVKDITMQSIRGWLDAAAPHEARELREQNASYVFFRELSELGDAQGPVGAQGVPLTPERSLAVDRRYHAMGTPVWVSIAHDDGKAPMQRLMIAQDTGGAIRGPVRGDFYWGTGEVAGDNAGRMNASGKMFVLLPKAVAATLPAEAVQ